MNTNKNIEETADTDIRKSAPEASGAHERSHHEGHAGYRSEDAHHGHHRHHGDEAEGHCHHHHHEEEGEGRHCHHHRHGHSAEEGHLHHSHGESAGHLSHEGHGSRDAGHGESASSSSELICPCMGTTRDDIFAVVAAGTTTAEDVERATGAGTRCGRCRAAVAAVVEEALAQTA